jgi:hypothetical protein
MEGDSWGMTMTAHTPQTTEVRIVARSDDHWDIISAHYRNGELHIEFKDGTQGSISTSQFPALASATDTDFDDLQVSPCGLILENANITWDCAEAGLYELISS